MKIYTKTGDSGETALFGGRRVSKTHARIEAYGLVDQLNAELAIVRLHIDDVEVDGMLERVQMDLFSLGADLATPHDIESDYVVRMSMDKTLQLETEMDRLDAELPPLKTFILPGGTPSAAYLHHARTVCRQTERATVHLTEIESVSPAALIYLNRLSDWLFVLARTVNYRQQTPDIPWVSPASAQRNGQTKSEVNV